LSNSTERFEYPVTRITRIIGTTPPPKGAATTVTRHPSVVSLGYRGTFGAGLVGHPVVWYVSANAVIRHPSTVLSRCTASIPQ
jgi:hypothetical protein